MKNFELDRQTLFTRCFPAIYENYLESFNTNKTKVRLFEDAKDYEMSGKDEEVNYVKNNMDKISDFTGNQVTYFLSPETGDKIIAAIEKYQSNMQTLHRLNDFVNY